MVEVEFDFGRSRFITSELELLNEILVGDLSESTSFIGIEVDVINVEFSIKRGVGFGTTEDTAFGSEFNVDLDFVVLESNEGKSKTRVSAKPELKRNVKSSAIFCVVTRI